MSTLSQTKPSGANIQIPSAQPPVPLKPATTVDDRPVSDRTALFQRLKVLLAECAPHANRNEQVNVLIAACIAEGKTAGSEIVGIVAHLGFNPQHVGKLIHLGTGTNSAVHQWHRSADGAYSLLT